jgi:hypothetical protein
MECIRIGLAFKNHEFAKCPFLALHFPSPNPIYMP